MSDSNGNGTKPTAGFSADVYLAANEPPTFQIGGRIIVGRFVSADEWFRLQGVIAAWAAQGTRERASEIRLLKALVRASFPRHWWELWKPDVWRCLLRLPYGAQMLAVESFTAAQVNAQRGPPAWAAEMARRVSRTNGIVSPA